jgi:hypothetical protein
MTNPDTVLASTHTALEAITTYEITDCTMPEMARRLDLIQRIQTACAMLTDEITEILAGSMEDDTVTIAGVGNIVRRRKTSSTWLDDAAKERMYDDAVRAIIARVAVDPMTGEVHPPLANTVREAWGLITESFSIGADPKTGFRKLLGLQTDMYRAKRTTGYTVSITEETL